ncbi:MAG: SIS domain-containing protein [Thermodesulfobacteriota bacterium]|nr:SIS domain-containing protein [Thermodesulfobacteriota bacterium]
MNLAQDRYTKYSLIKDMLATVEAVKAIDVRKINGFALKIKKQKVFFTGEGSSRIFPAHNTVYNLLQYSSEMVAITESAIQAMEYDLEDYTVFVASNSGRTKEVIRLIQHLLSKKHDNIIALTSDGTSPVAQMVRDTYVLSCGPEGAVAATKSVVEQALFYDILLRNRSHKSPVNLNKLADLLKIVLQMEIPLEVIEKTAPAEVIYFAGRNNGVAEELTLKANEVVRKKSDFLEGTYTVHGIEEVITDKDILIIIDPFPQEEEKYRSVMMNRVGLPIFAISHRQSLFPTILLPRYNGFNPYLQLVAGWNLLVEIGLMNKVDLDHPQRARKIGNEFEEENQ